MLSASSISWSAVRLFHRSVSAPVKRWQKKTQLPFQQELRNPVDVVYGSHNPLESGHIYDKKPFKVSVKKYHVYDWCGCGLSKQQPFCDGTHLNRYIKKAIKGGPVKYIAPENRDVWFCNCKQTKNRPFCDGSHRTDEVMEAVLDGKFDIWEPKS